MQTITGKINTEGCLIFEEMKIDPQIGLFDCDRRSLSSSGTELIDNGILDP